MKNERGELELIFIGALFAIAVIGFAVYAFLWYGTTDTKTCTVLEKQATAKEGGTKYLLFTKECGQLQVADDMLLGNYNSTDVFAGIKEGSTYHFETVGFRNGFFSAYPNVDEVQS